MIAGHIVRFRSVSVLHLRHLADKDFPAFQTSARVAERRKREICIFRGYSSSLFRRESCPCHVSLAGVYPNSPLRVASKQK